MANEKSCIGCKFLYMRDAGYSNYTVECTVVECAINRNDKLPADRPYDWKEEDDNWPLTNAGRCDSYAAGPTVWLDVDGETSAKDQTDDQEVIDAIDGNS